MADPVSLACLGNKIGEKILDMVVDGFVATIQKQFKYMCCFNSNMADLETHSKELEAAIQGVQMAVDNDHTNMIGVGPEVENWLEGANEVKINVKGIMEDKDKVKERCWNGWCPNLILRYKLSRKAVKNSKAVIDVQAKGDKYSRASHGPRRLGLETLRETDSTGFESRRLKMEEIIKALTDDGINMIGVCGMGGLGKTTIAKEVSKQVLEDRLFEEVAWAFMGKEANIATVQDRIADGLGFTTLRDKKNAIERVELLCERLLQDNKKVLVILDGIWAEFDLKAMGIPLGGTNKNCKMLYTSRIGGLWPDLQTTKKEICLELLSKDEAWELFREKAGDLADAPDLRPIAQQIVEKCGHLPLALALIGRLLLKKSRENAIMMWKNVLHQLTNVSSTLADGHLYPGLELSYEHLENKESQQLFLLCCLLKEDEAIHIEDLARYGWGLLLFEGMNDLEEVRCQIFDIVDDLKSRYLLHDGKDDKHVKVHGVVRDMGISIATKSKDKCALVNHGAVSQWPKPNSHEQYTAISVISEEIKELPKEWTYPNVEFLSIRCRELQELPSNSFEEMGKLKVLALNHFGGIFTLQSSRNLTMLSLEGFCGMLDNASSIGDLLNLEILNFRYSKIKELPQEIGKLDKLRLLDLKNTYYLTRIPPRIISCLLRLEELYFCGSGFNKWEGEGKEEGINANLRELESLSHLNTLEILIRSEVLTSEVHIFENLKKYMVIIGEPDDLTFLSKERWERVLYVNAQGDQIQPSFFNPFYDRDLALHSGKDIVAEIQPQNKPKRLEELDQSFPHSSDPISLECGWIGSLLGRSDWVHLEGEGCNDLVRELHLRAGVDGLQQMKFLEIKGCGTPKCLANTTTNPNHQHTPVIFPILQYLTLSYAHNLKEICCGPVPAGSFGELTSIKVHHCHRLENLFQVPVSEGCLSRLEAHKRGDYERTTEVFRKDQREEMHVAANNGLVFLKLKTLRLRYLPSLMGFCRGIDQIDFPHLKQLYLEGIPQVNFLFHNNCNLSSNSKQNDNDGFVSLFPQKVSLPSLEDLQVAELDNLERVGHGSLLVGSFSRLNKFAVHDCGKLLYVFTSQFLPILQGLQELNVRHCPSLEELIEWEGLEFNDPDPEILFALNFVKLFDIPKLSCISKRDFMGYKYIQTLEIYWINSLICVFEPTMTKSIPHLRKLKISWCKMLTGIVAEENGLGESSVNKVQFPELKLLDLQDLPNLVSFFPNVNVNTTSVGKSTDHRNPLQPQPLFNEKVAIPNLEELKVHGLMNVDLWCSEVPTRSPSKLKQLEVSGCPCLRNVFHPSTVGGLVNLQGLSISNCSTLEAVVGNEEQVGGLTSDRTIDKTLFPQLRNLWLNSLPNLMRFCHFTHPLEMPLLHKMNILDCPNMDAFSSGSVSTQNLCLPGTSRNGDLNNAIPLLKEKKEKTPICTRTRRTKRL